MINNSKEKCVDNLAGDIVLLCIESKDFFLFLKEKENLFFISFGDVYVDKTNFFTKESTNLIKFSDLKYIWKNRNNSDFYLLNRKRIDAL